MQENLNTMKGKLSDSDISSLVLIIGAHCGRKTKARLESVLRYGIGTIGSYGIYNRVFCDKVGGHNSWHYVAGQSYTDEIRTVRSLIIGGK